MPQPRPRRLQVRYSALHLPLPALPLLLVVVCLADSQPLQASRLATPVAATTTPQPLLQEPRAVCLAIPLRNQLIRSRRCLVPQPPEQAPPAQRLLVACLVRVAAATPTHNLQLADLYSVLPASLLRLVDSLETPARHLPQPPPPLHLQRPLLVPPEAYSATRTARPQPPIPHLLRNQEVVSSATPQPPVQGLLHCSVPHRQATLLPLQPPQPSRCSEV